MKKLSKIMLSIFMLAFAGVLVACGEKPTTPDATVYTITAEESDFYDVNGQTRSATAGTSAYVTIVPEFECVQIDKVLYNGQECTAGENNKYTFTMPSENVTITVSYSFVDNTTDNFLTWDDENASSFTVFDSQVEGSYYAPFDDGELVANVSKDPSGTGGYFTEHEQTAFSTNEDVIPNNALSVSVTNEGTSNSACAFTVKINRTLIKEGTTQIVLLVDNGHKFEDSSLLVCTITVTK